MLRKNLTYIKITFWVIVLLLPIQVYSQSPDKVTENNDMYQTFLSLMNNDGNKEEFYAFAEEYLKALKNRNSHIEYFKILTNVGFYDVSHVYVPHALQTVKRLDEEMTAHNDTTLNYLLTGLKADVARMMHVTDEADSLYRVALRQVGDRDIKFAMHIHMGLAETHYLSNREEALKWSDMAIEEARQLNDYEFLSLGLGLKCFLYFMMAEADDFYKYESMLEDLRSEYQERYDAGSLGKRQAISHRFDAEIKVAHCAFNGDFAKAFELVENANTIATPNLVKFRLYAMQGTYEKSQLASRLRWWLIGLTLVYVFVYIMGRRRLMRKIWKKTDELKAALKRADDASKMKSVFIRSMSHEIRTPLNAINGFTQVLCSPAFTLTEQEKNDLRDRVSSNTDAITIIINELLEIAAGENVKLNPDELRNVCVNRVCNMAMAEAKKENVKNLELSFTTELTDDFTIKSNAETVSQILSKIIDNAMKFTDKGSVEVSANAIGRNVEISVTDTGIGIPDEKRDAIFESFVKLDDFRGGIGLGLSICRRLARTLGGNVILDPKYKNGSRFILQLPIEFGA